MSSSGEKTTTRFYEARITVAVDTEEGHGPPDPEALKDALVSAFELDLDEECEVFGDDNEHQITGGEIDWDTAKLVPRAPWE